MKGRLLLFICISLVAINVNAQLKNYDFKYGKLFYKIINAENKEVYVVAEKGKGKYTTKLEGDIDIPEKVANEDGIEYDVVGIGKYAFYMCEGITNVTLPKSLKKINEKAFLGCHNLTTLNIPENVKSIGKWAFISCAKLKEINVDSNNANYSSLNGALYNKDITKIIQCPCGKTGAFEIPATVKEIGGQTFYGCMNLNEVTIPSGVEKIGNDGFYACVKLRNIICKIVVPLTGDAMGTEVFEQVSTASVGGNCVLYVPEGSVEAYSEAAQWKNFSPNIKEILSSEIKSNTFSTFKAKGGTGEIVILQEEKGKQIEIFDLYGKLVKTVKNNSPEFSIPFSKGVYIVKYSNHKMKVIVK